MAEEEVNKKSKANKEKAFKTWYSELLQTINTSYLSNDNISLLTNADLPDNKEGLLQEVRASCNAIEDYKRRGILHYARFGLVLAKLKILYFNKCSFCTVMSPKPDMFKILSCNNCIHISNSKEFFSNLKDIVSYANSYINFLINVANLCEYYPKFRYTCKSLTEIKLYMSFLIDQMKKDKHLWQ